MPTTRRGFLGAAAGAAAAAALATPFPAAARSAVPDPTAAPGTPVPTGTPAGASPTPTPVPPDPRAEALVRLARERYGKFLTSEELAMLDERVTAIERRGVRLRAVKLSNSEEPASDFRVVRR